MDNFQKKSSLAIEKKIKFGIILRCKGYHRIIQKYTK